MTQIIDRKLLAEKAACGSWTRFIIDLFPDGAAVTKANIKRLIAAIRSKYNGNEDRETRVDVGTALNWLLYHIKGTNELNTEYNWASTSVKDLEAAFWELWGEKEKPLTKAQKAKIAKEKALEEWKEKITDTWFGTEFAEPTISKGRVVSVEIGCAKITKKDFIKFGKLLKWL